MKRSIIILLIITLFSTCIYFFLSKSKSSGAESFSAKDENLITVNTEILDNLEIQTIKITKEPMVTLIELTGETEAPSDAVTDVPARLPGRITKVFFVEGDRITKGQKLAIIDSPELANLRSNYQITKSKLTSYEQNVKRIETLVKMNLAAKQELIDAETNLNIILAEKKATEESLRVNGLPIDNSVSGIYIVYAPKSGLSISRNAVPGSIVQANQILTTIVDLSTVWFQAKVFEDHLQYLKEGVNANIILNAYPEISFEGKLEHIGEKVDPVSRTVHARIVFKNKNALAKIGLFGKVSFGVNKKLTFVLPKESIQSYQNKSYVFQKINETEFLWKEIKIGSEYLGKVEAIDNLNEGDEIVVGGAFALKAIKFKSSFGGE
ncbi:efflux RND transporter periplasmic adaptor subunit [Leptospira sp. 96542]|nr:efflux RND transporter periplasmic adaptor subunit [Leptospira sp. 96542]